MVGINNSFVGSTPYLGGGGSGGGGGGGGVFGGAMIPGLFSVGIATADGFSDSKHDVGGIAANSLFFTSKPDTDWINEGEG